MVFQPEDTERSIHIKIIDDDTVESDEQFLLQLSPNKDELVCLNRSNTAIITILDDDSMLLIIIKHLCNRKAARTETSWYS